PSAKVIKTKGERRASRHRASSPRMRLRSTIAIVIALALPSAAVEAAALFTKPLHITRSIDEPLSGKTIVVEQYCFGSRVVTIRGDHTIIADYDHREITEIDRANATYSVTKFEEFAATRPARQVRKSDAVAVVREGSARRGGRNVELFSVDDPGLRMEIAVDASIDLSRDAFDVMIGAAYPASGGAEADLARGAARISR